MLKSVRVWAAVAAGVVTLVVATVVGNPLVSRATEAERGSDLGAVRLRALAEAGARISYHAKTGKVRFIGVEPVQAIAVAASTSAVAEPETVARSFLGEYGTLFGIADQASELALERQETDALGGGIVRFQQRYRGIPVFGGELIVTTDATKRVLAVGGEVLPELAVDVAPAVQGGQAAEQAKAFVAAATGLDSGQLTTTEPELWVYNPGLVGGAWARGLVACVASGGDWPRAGAGGRAGIGGRATGRGSATSQPDPRRAESSGLQRQQHEHGAGNTGRQRGGRRAD